MVYDVEVGDSKITVRPKKLLIVGHVDRSTISLMW